MQKIDPREINKRLQKALAEHRKAKGITQVELAKQLGKPQSFVSKYETGERKLTVGDFIEVVKGLKIDPGAVMRQWLYYSRTFNEMVYQMPRIFPMGDTTVQNRLICVSGVGHRGKFSALMGSSLPSMNFADMDNNQCFPLYVYNDGAVADDEEAPQGDLLTNATTRHQGVQRREAITDEGLLHFQTAYPGEAITKDELFYYVYGLLHSEDYRSRYADNLSKELPRIPAVKSVADFRAFVAAGRKLADLHCDYEQAEPYPVSFIRGNASLIAPPDPVSFYRVEQMKFPGKRGNQDKTTIIYNSNITVTGIPLEAYDYFVNGQSAIEWIMEMQSANSNTSPPKRKTGIVNDANRYATETVGDPAYPLMLLRRIITVSLETMKIVRALPKLGDLK